jgi:tRNA modification GTPase
MTPARPESIDTIVAQATAPGRSAIAVIRLSGTGARAIATRLFRRERGTKPGAARRAVLGEFLDEHGVQLDQGLLIWFPAPHSYTGEDLVECHLHGSPVLVRQWIASCLALGARLAEPGEFTRRALHAGKLDLTRVEAIADLIAAESAEQGRIALRQLRGEVATALQPTADELLWLLADVEASLDFADSEADLGLAGQDTQVRAAAIATRLSELLANSQPAARVREGARVVLLGPPNSGKSSLFNRLLGHDRVIVSPEAGTTRDLIEETIVIEGLPVTLCDTAGVGEMKSIADRLGQERATQAATRADLVLAVYNPKHDYRPAIEGALAVATHGDLLQQESLVPGSIVVSSHDGSGFDQLRSAIAGRLQAPGTAPLESVALATSRHRAAAERAQAALARAGTLAQHNAGLELVAVELRAALTDLRAILGDVDTEQLLGVIFSRFCIGK